MLFELQYRKQTMRGKGLSIKDVRSQGGLSNADIFRTRGEVALQMRTSALFVQKNFGFFEIYGVSARTRGVNFSRFCAEAFYGRPLTDYWLEFFIPYGPLL